jgi:predicted amidohydrolase
VNASLLRVAAAQYPIEFLPAWAAFEAKIVRWVGDAADRGARFLLFPEYHSLELASLCPEEVRRSPPRQLTAMQQFLPEFLSLHQRLADEKDLHILAGTFPVLDGAAYRNRAHLFRPRRPVTFQDKRLMTRFERERWGVSPGKSLAPLATDWGPVGVAVCYDSEFPLVARSLVDAGAWILLVPSCTDTLAGHHRVRIGCQARALENQCYVVQSSTVGEAPWSDAVDVNIGAAAVYAPPDNGFPDDGVVARGELNKPQWVYAEVDPARMEAVRRDGQVFNHRDWTRQSAG